MTIDLGDAEGVTVVGGDGTRTHRDRLELTADESRQLFARSGAIGRVEWTIGHDPTTS